MQSSDSFGDSSTLINSQNLVTLINCLAITKLVVLRSTVTKHDPMPCCCTKTARFAPILHRLVKENYSNSCLLLSSDAFLPLLAAALLSLG